MVRPNISKARLFPDLPGIRKNVLQVEDENREEFLAWKLRYGGSFPEFLVFQELEKRRYQPGIDFDYQASFFGGRNKLGGAVIDFYLPDGDIAGRVQGVYFHYRTIEQKSFDTIQRLLLEQSGTTVVDMLEDEIIQSVSLVVGLFIQGRETQDAIARRT